MRGDRREARTRALERQVEQQMTDTRFNALRGRRGRQVLVVGTAVVIALGPVAWLVGGSLWGIASVVVAALLWWALRLSVRTVADLPEEFLDERQERVRDRAYLDAYRVFAAVMVVGSSTGLVAFIVLGQDPDTWSVSLTWNGVSAIFWAVTALALALPSMALAVRERPEQPDH